jgi:predicted nucleic acid-binding protein
MTLWDGRPGAEKVEDILNLGIEGKVQLLMSVVNWGEVYYTVWLGRGQAAAQAAMGEFGQLPIEIVDADVELTRLAAKFRATHKLHYADCFVAALAHQRKASVVTSDTDFRIIKDEISLIETTSGAS